MSLSMVVKWAGKEYSMENIDPEDTVLDLKVKIQTQTGVRPERQKLLNLKVKGVEFLVKLEFSVKILFFRSSCYR